MPGGGADDFLIIDGQQRITTVCLILLAMYRNLKEGNVISSDVTLAEKIWKKYIIDEYQPDQRKVRLKPIKDDCAAFDKLVFSDNREDYITSSNITINYNYFYNLIKASPVSMDELFESIRKLVIIDIFL